MMALKDVRTMVMIIVTACDDVMVMAADAARFFDT